MPWSHRTYRKISAFAICAAPLFITAIAEASSVWDKNPDPDQVVLIAGAFGLIAGVARLMFYWDPRVTWQRSTGSVLVASLAAVAGALGIYSIMSHVPTLIMFTAIVSGWLGAEFLDLVSKRYVLHLLEVTKLKKKEDEPKEG